ncbi:nucleoside triphosphate pyrophosphohydrolase [Desulfobacca acetoxidans]|uniref:Nucleoside triphosphate pyrophosphohydrolase n=1 Tax=Desulfobacca acetoxidans (strain ATCC 700848 / DSM 11109 / ASRB2) TaxID=880072 RepID=F2NDT7_DESAR|nr:nucleoside triphosphate pyrophosphohydrolase [Desulfobacca acetoxidans]AEB10434.1 MazG family protein [Desulfobacca acetoxidans DSM 11109]
MSVPLPHGLEKQVTPAAALSALVEVIRRLRGPGGCPWDAKQTPDTLKTYMLEEAYELVEALDSREPDKIQEELGDVLLHIVMLSEMYREHGDFSLTEVIEGIRGKMIHRHPHVFGQEKAETLEDLRSIWQRAKAAEGKAEAKSLLAEVSPGQPALRQAQRLGEAAARVGFDWPDIHGVLDKFEEELAEFREALQAADSDHQEEELGDLLFCLVNVARFLHIDSEGALRRTIHKFIKRFHLVERALLKQGKTPETASLEEMDTVWEEVKNRLRGR